MHGQQTPYDGPDQSDSNAQHEAGETERDGISRAPQDLKQYCRQRYGRNCKVRISAVYKTCKKRIPTSVTTIMCHVKKN